jgi:hypothetical protein
MKPALAILGALVLGGCDVNMERAGPIEHTTQSIDLDKSEMARIEIKMGAGELQLDGGSPKLLDADFTYNISSWKPVINDNASGFRRQITIEQPRRSHGGSHMTYQWNLRLNNTVPLDVVAHLGAGTARMNLGSVDLRSLEVNMGVGEVRLDLTGKPQRDYTVKLNGGVGKATVFLPPTVGVIASAHGGIGDISVRGLEKRNGFWMNPAHEQAPVTIHLDVNGGIGQIQIIAE